MENYKDTEKYLTLLHSKEWVETIDQLKKLETQGCDNEKKDYYVIYKEEKQRKDRRFCFNTVKFIAETNSFIFTSYQTSWMDGTLTDKVSSIETIRMIDIISLDIGDKVNLGDYICSLNKMGR